MSGALLQAAMIVGGRVLQLDAIPGSLADLGASTTTYGAQIAFETDGDIRSLRTVGSDTTSGQWVDPADAGETTDAVKWDYTSGDNTSNTGDMVEDTYIAITSTREHGITHTSSGGEDTIDQNCDFYIAEDTGGTGEVGPEGISLTCGELF